MEIDDRLRAFFYAYDKSLALDARAEVVEEGQGYVKRRLTYTSIHDEVVPATLYTPQPSDGTHPALLLQHGASTKKDDVYIQQPSRRWCQAGYVTMAIDAPSHGERAQEAPVTRAEYWRRGLIYRMRDQRVQGVVDLMRALDVLEARPEVDAGRIGYMGVSMGTFLGVPLTALDERVRSAVFIIGGGGFRRIMGDPKGADAGDVDLVLRVTDPVYFAPRIAPRPVLMLNGEHDETVPRAAAEALYGALREPKEIRWFDMAHTVTGAVYKQTLQFFDETLRS